MSNSYYILPVHNKEELIENVLKGIETSHSNKTEPTVICILDGCYDKTEEKVLAFKENYKYKNNFHILRMNDVHEIECLNTGLEFIEKNFSPKDEDLIFSIQDDVILDEPDIDLKFDTLFNDNTNLGYISMRLGVDVYTSGGDLKEENYKESEFGHWNQLQWNFHEVVKHNEFKVSEIAIRSPTCMLWGRYREVGFFDMNLAPCGFDCHDMSIRLNKSGYVNGVYGLKFRSDVNWGTMRSDKPSSYNDQVGAIYERNRRYLVIKHKDCFGVK
jgi:hypothetical protein